MLTSEFATTPGNRLVMPTTSMASSDWASESAGWTGWGIFGPPAGPVWANGWLGVGRIGRRRARGDASESPRARRQPPEHCVRKPAQTVSAPLLTWWEP